MVALVIAGTMLLWMAAQWIGSTAGLAARYVFLVDLLALAGFTWALVVGLQLRCGEAPASQRRRVDERNAGRAKERHGNHGPSGSPGATRCSYDFMWARKIVLVICSISRGRKI